MSGIESEPVSLGTAHLTPETALAPPAYGFGTGLLRSLDRCRLSGLEATLTLAMERASHTQPAQNTEIRQVMGFI